MTTEQLETANAADTGAPSPQTTPSAPATAPASTPPVDLEKVRKEAKAEGYREAQAAADRQKAKELRAQQAAQAGRQRLAQAGVRDEAVLDDLTPVIQKARLYDEIQSEAQAEAESQRMAAEIAEVYGVSPNDPRVLGADTWEGFRAKVKAAAAEDAQKEREQMLKDAEAEKRKAADSRIAAGELDTVSAAGAAPAPVNDEDHYKKEMRAARGRGAEAGRAIRSKWRQKGVNVDEVRWAD